LGEGAIALLAPPGIDATAYIRTFTAERIELLCGWGFLPWLAAWSMYVGLCIYRDGVSKLTGMHARVYRVLYWTDWNTAAIYRSSVIRPARETVVSGSLLAPTALAINFNGNCLAN